MIQKTKELTSCTLSKSKTVSLVEDAGELQCITILYKYNIVTNYRLWGNVPQSHVWKNLQSEYLKSSQNSAVKEIVRRVNENSIINIRRSFIQAKLRIVTWEADSQESWELSHLLDVYSVQFSHSDSLGPPWTAAHQASLSITNSWSLLKFMSIELVMPYNHLILCCPLLLPPSILSQHQDLFKWVSSLHQVAKVLEFQLQQQSLQ